MTITYVGGVTNGRAGSTSTTTQSLTGLTGGSDSSPSAGDLVVVWCSVGTAVARVASSQTISGNNSGAYSNLTFQSQADTNYSQSQLNYKMQGSTPDTQITIPSSGNSRNAQRWVVHVFRGVDGTTPLDVTSVPAQGADTGRPNPGAITPTTAGAWIVAFYASAAATGAAYTAPTDFATDWLGGTTADTYDCMQGGGYYTGWTSGSYDPAAITEGGTTGTGDSWTAMTLALRPYINTPPTVALNSPADTGSTSDTTPTLDFTGTDADSDDIRYNIYISKIVATDNFNRSDGGLGSNWSDTADEGGYPIINTNAVESVDDGDSASFWNADSFANNQYSQIKIVNASTSSYCGALVRASATNFVMGQEGVDGTGVDIYWYNGGSYELIASDPTHDPSDGDILRLEAIGQTYYLYVNGVLKCSGTNMSTPASGSAGFVVSTATGVIDDWEGGDIIANAISGTDAGFANPDNGGDTDPFTSGENIQYTVQSALDPGTYYWRVRGIDPSGSNTYGDWSSTYSFTITSSTVDMSAMMTHVQVSGGLM